MVGSKKKTSCVCLVVEPFGIEPLEPKFEGALAIRSPKLTEEMAGFLACSENEEKALAEGQAFGGPDVGRPGGKGTQVYCTGRTSRMPLC